MKTLNLYHLFGILRYGTVNDNKIELLPCDYGGGFYPATTIENHLFPIFKVVDGVYPTADEWTGFINTYRCR